TSHLTQYLNLIPTRRSSDLNLNWAFSIEDMRQELGMKALDVINDFAALAYATPFLRDDDIKLLHAGKKNSTAAMVVFGPGTGFRSEEHTSESSHVKISYAVF